MIDFLTESAAARHRSWCLIYPRPSFMRAPRASYFVCCLRKPRRNCGPHDSASGVAFVLLALGSNSLSWATFNRHEEKTLKLLPSHPHALHKRVLESRASLNIYLTCSPLLFLQFNCLFFFFSLFLGVENHLYGISINK